MLLVSQTLGQRGSQGYTPQVNAGDRAFGRNEFQAALSYYRAALQWNSNGLEAHVGLGNVYRKLGRQQKALEQYAAALKINPHSAVAERGIHEARSEGQEQEAFQTLENEAIREPRNADIQTTYSEELLERDRIKDAKERAELAVGLDARQWHAYGVLGQIALRSGDYNTARTDLQTAVRHDPSDDDSVLALGDLEFAQQNYGDAVRAYLQLTKLVPEESEGHRKLAAAYSKLGNHTAAKVESDLALAIEKAAGTRGGKE